MEKIMIKTNGTSNLEHGRLADNELDAVSGGASDLGKYITKAVDDAISVGVGGGPPDVWVGCAWVPGRW